MLLIFLFVFVRAFKLYSLGKFQLYDTVLSTTVTFYIREIVHFNFMSFVKIIKLKGAGTQIGTSYDSV